MRYQLRYRLGAVALAMSLVAGCSDSEGPPPPPPSAITVTTGSEPPPRFIPAVATLAAGGEVTFTNGSPVEHNVTTGTGAWEATTLAPTESFSVTLPTAGTYSYQCTIHPGMNGTITVE